MTHVLDLDLDGILPAIITVSRSRAVAGGIDPNQYDTVTSQLRTAREWPAAFMATANEHLTRANTSSSAGNTVTAGEAYLSAAAWFHFATIVPHPDRTGHQEAADAMVRALQQVDPTALHLTGARFAGILRTPPNRTSGPLVVIVPGLDSSKEEFHPVAEVLLRRGIATFSLDGPGQGELARSTASVPDYQHVVSDALDAISGKDIWNPTAIGIIGLSLGGFYGALSLAHEPRLSAGVTVSGPLKLTWEQLPPFVTDTAILRTGTPAAAKQFIDQVDLTDIAVRIKQPLLVIDGGNDIIPGVINGKPLAQQAQHGEYLLVPEGDHLIGNARWKWLPTAADWLARQLHT